MRLIIALVGLAISFALPTFSQDQNTVDPEVRQQIEAVHTKFVEAQNKGDAAALAALFTQDAVQVWYGVSEGGSASGQRLRKGIERLSQRYPPSTARLYKFTQSATIYARSRSIKS